MTIPKEITAYIDGLMGRSPRTRINYESFANNFWEFLGPKNIDEVTVDDVMGFLKTGANEKNWKPITVKQYARLARSILYEYRDENFMKKLKKALRALPKTSHHSSLYEGNYIPPDKIDRFIANAENEEYAVFYTMILKWGLRLSEALSLSPIDIDVSNNEVVVHGKGLGGMNKLRRVLVEKSTITRALQFACCTQAEINGERLIKDTRPIIKTIKARNAEYKWKDCAMRTGLKNWDKLTPHDGRHSYAIDFLIKRKEEGYNAIVLLKRQLGHSSITTTQIYLDIAGTEARDIFNAGVAGGM